MPLLSQHAQKMERKKLKGFVINKRSAKNNVKEKTATNYDRLL